MSQACRKVRHATVRPIRRAVAPGIRTLQRVVSIPAIIIYEKMHLSFRRIVPIRRGAFHPGAKVRIVPAWPRPGPGKAIGRVLDKDGLQRFVLQEAEHGVWVAGIGQNGQVDDIGRRVVDVCLGRGEGLEIAGVGSTNLNIGRSSRVICVALVILQCQSEVFKDSDRRKLVVMMVLRTNLEAQCTMYWPA